MFDLSKSLLSGRYDTAYRILDRLFFSGRNRWRSWECSFPPTRICTV